MPVQSYVRKHILKRCYVLGLLDMHALFFTHTSHVYTHARTHTHTHTHIRTRVCNLRCDPKGRACMIASIEKQKFVYVLNRDNAANLTISSPLEAHKSNNIVFSIVGMDCGFDNPVFAAIELDYREADNVREGCVGGGMCVCVRYVGGGVRGCVGGVCGCVGGDVLGCSCGLGM